MNKHIPVVNNGAMNTIPQRKQNIHMANGVGASPSYVVAAPVAAQQSNNAPSQSPNTFMFVKNPGVQPGLQPVVRVEENKIDYDNAHVGQKDMVVPTSYTNLPYDYKGNNDTDSDRSDSEDEASDASENSSDPDSEAASDDDSDYSSSSERDSK
mmetsp:Transcript_22982/g.25520  ORF Transcript_22982/g.25520 Transcript_22982/m.25520 type:complete len:154 (+) Transcript_22982:122-583(+)